MRFALRELKELFWKDKIHELAMDTFLKYELDDSEPYFTQQEANKFKKQVHLSEFSDMYCLCEVVNSSLEIHCFIGRRKVIEIFLSPISALRFYFADITYAVEKKKSLEVGFYELAEKFPKFYLENLSKWDETKINFLKDNYIKK